MSGTTETLTFRPRRQQRAETLALRCTHDERMDRAVRRRQQLAQRHPATVAQLNQLMNLLLRAPDIQEEILALKYPAGRERTLRRLPESLVWEDQRALWVETCPAYVWSHIRVDRSSMRV